MSELEIFLAIVGIELTITIAIIAEVYLARALMKLLKRAIKHLEHMGVETA
jgi:hypothetical protein